MTPITLAQAIPVRYRQAIYSILATLVLLEGIFDVVDDGLEGKILAALVVFGFGVSLSNTKTLPPPPPPAG